MVRRGPAGRDVGSNPAPHDTTTVAARESLLVVVGQTRPVVGFDPCITRCHCCNSLKKCHTLKDGGDASCNRPTTPFALQAGPGDGLDGWYVMTFAVNVAGSNPALVPEKHPVFFTSVIDSGSGVGVATDYRVTTCEQRTRCLNGS